MTSIRDQIGDVLTADTGSGGFMDMLAAGASSLVGLEGGSPPQPGAMSGPWAYLALLATVPKFPIASRLQPSGAMSGGHQLWLYDEETAGYTRLRALAVRAMKRFGPYDVTTWQTVKWSDDDTGEVVYGLDVPTFSNETADQDSGQLLLIVTFPWVLAYRVQSVA